MKIKAFGTKIYRKKAYDLIIRELVYKIVFLRNPDYLTDLLLSGWKGLLSRSDYELEAYIKDLDPENPPRSDY